MTPEQLASARAAHWRQNAQPLLTLEEATAWIEQMQLALYLPRKAHVLAPAPSFAEAILGQGSATPSPEAIQQANALLVRMVMEGTVVPLNLFGTPGEQPDFLIAIQALPHLAALQPDRNWKKAPARTGPGKVSPLAIEIWKLLDREGALTANEIREQLGHELTEAATIRGLSELWQNLRVAPLPAAEGNDAHWQLLTVTHKKEMAAGGTMAQSAALSMMVANYLQSIVTGTAEDVEAFLSPLASRSRLRDVIRGLTATRQLKSLSMDAQTFLFIEGTLPEMPEVAASATEGTAEKPAFMGRSAYRERMLNKGKDDEATQDSSSEAPRRAPFRPGSDKPPFRSERPPFRRPAEGGAAPRRFAAGGASRPGRSDRPAFGDRGGERSAGRPLFRKTGSGQRPDRPSFPRSADRERPASDRSGSGRPASDRPGFDRPRTGVRFGASRPGRPFAGRAGSDRPSFDRTASDRPGSRPFSPRPFKPREEGGASSDRPAFKPRSFDREAGNPGGARPFRPREGGDRPRTGEGRSFPPRTGARPSFGSRSDAPVDPKNKSRAGFMSRSGGRPGRPTGDRPRPDRSPGDRPSMGRPRPPRADGDRPFSPRPRTGGSEGRPPQRFGGKPSFPRRDPGDAGGERRPPRTDGRSSGFPSNPNRPSRTSRPGGSFVKRDGPPGRPSTGRPSTGRPGTGGSRPPARGGKPGFRLSGPGAEGRSPGFSPGRNPGGTGRPGGPRVGAGRPGGRPGGRPDAGRGGKPGGSRPSGIRPGGMKPPVRKPRPESDSE